MNEIEAKDEIRIIREMLERTKMATAESGAFFLTWGFLIILAVIGNYALAFIEEYGLIWLNWLIFAVAGVVFSVVYWGRKEKERGVRTYAGTAAGYLGTACGISFMFVGLLFPAFKVYSWGAIAMLVTTIYAILLFTLGGIFDWRLLKGCGAASWLVALGMIFIPDVYRALAFVPLVLFGYIVPGFILRSQYQKERAKL